MHSREISRRKVLEYALYGTGAFLLTSLLRSSTPEFYSSHEWPTDQEGILRKIETLNFVPGSEIHTNFMPRKHMYETAKLWQLTNDPRWKGGDESDWQKYPEAMDYGLGRLADSGVAGARLVVAPFEVTSGDGTYNWNAIDQMLEMFHKHKLKASLSIGPIDFPFGPDGIRLPLSLEQMLREEMAQTGVDHMDLDITPDANLPRSSEAIFQFSLEFVRRILERYSQDPRIDMFYIMNEWPDNHSVEKVPGTIKASQAFMEKIIRLVMSLTQKQLGLNTNIPPSESWRMQKDLGPIFELLGQQGFLGLDPYPTEEAKHATLRHEMAVYGSKHVQYLREFLPLATIGFTEYQGELWPPDGVAGKPWAEIQKNYPKLVEEFFQKKFPPSLIPYMVESRVQRNGLYGGDQWVIAEQMNYGFSLRMMQRISHTMKKAS